VYISLHNCSNYTHYVNRYVNAPSLSSAPLSLPLLCLSLSLSLFLFRRPLVLLRGSSSARGRFFFPARVFIRLAVVDYSNLVEARARAIKRCLCASFMYPAAISFCRASRGCGLTIARVLTHASIYIIFRQIRIADRRSRPKIGGPIRRYRADITRPRTRRYKLTIGA